MRTGFPNFGNNFQFCQSYCSMTQLYKRFWVWTRFKIAYWESSLQNVWMTRWDCSKEMVCRKVELLNGCKYTAFPKSKIQKDFVWDVDSYHLLTPTPLYLGINRAMIPHQQIWNPWPPDSAIHFGFVTKKITVNVEHFPFLTDIPCFHKTLWILMIITPFTTSTTTKPDSKLCIHL